MKYQVPLDKDCQLELGKEGTFLPDPGRPFQVLLAEPEFYCRRQGGMSGNGL